MAVRSAVLFGTLVIVLLCALGDASLATAPARKAIAIQIANPSERVAVDKPSLVLAATDDACLRSIRRYIDLIDEQMAPVRISAAQVVETLRRVRPNCQLALDAQQQLLDAARTSKYFREYQESGHLVVFRFRTTENGNDFRVSFTFDRGLRQISVVNAIHANQI